MVHMLLIVWLSDHPMAKPMKDIRVFGWSNCIYLKTFWYSSRKIIVQEIFSLVNLFVTISNCNKSQCMSNLQSNSCHILYHFLHLARKHFYTLFNLTIFLTNFLIFVYFIVISEFTITKWLSAYIEPKNKEQKIDLSDMIH